MDSIKHKSSESISTTTTLVVGLWLYCLGIIIGLYLPDVDQVLMPILHHRSILTHSVILPGILLTVLMLLRKRNRVSDTTFLLGYMLSLGLFFGVSIHLSADALSPMRGFALIYLPIVKTSIGGELSLLWIGGNAVFLSYLALRLTNKLLLVNGVVFLSVAAGYAYYTENNLAATVPAALFALLPYVIRNSARKQIDAPTPLFDMLITRWMSALPRHFDLPNLVWKWLFYGLMLGVLVFLNTSGDNGGGSLYDDCNHRYC